ncbi:MAG: hypothetical protein SNJ79_06130 [Sphingomonadaceae bacterium]
MSLLYPRRISTMARIEIEQSDEHFHAHVELDDGLQIQPGDKVQVEGAPIMVPLNSRLVLVRPATIDRASAIVRAWTRAAAYLELAELYEVSFSPGRVS